VKVGLKPFDQCFQVPFLQPETFTSGTAACSPGGRAGAAGRG
jgi:hypothetical protein